MRFRFVGLVVSMGFMAGVAVAQNPPPAPKQFNPAPRLKLYRLSRVSRRG